MMGVGDERGIALLAVLGIILCLLPLAAAVSVQMQLDGLMQRNFRGSTEALYAAEAGLAQALSEVGARADFDDLLLQDHGETNAALDERVFPFRSQPPAGFVLDPIGYEVFIGRGPANTIRVRSRGHGHHDAVREVEGLIAPADAPFTPAALYIEAADVAIDLGDHGFQVSGIADQRPVPPIAGLAVSSAAAAVRLRQTLPPGAQVDGAGGSPSIEVSAGLELDSYAAALRRRLDAVILPAAPSRASQPFGTEARPQLTVVDSSWAIDAQVDGFGILVVRGDLEVTGSLRYRGLVLCTGNLIWAASSDVRIEGAAWVRSAAGARADFLGSGFIRYDATALGDTDSALALALLHLPVIVGWREAS